MLIRNQITKYPCGSRKEMAELYLNGLKRCNDCDKVLDLDRFSKRTSSRKISYPYRSICKKCENKQQRAKRENDIKRECQYCGKQGRGDESKSEFISNHKSRNIVSVCFECLDIHQERLSIESKNRQLYYSYGITLVEYNKILTIQNGKCAICQTSEYGSKSDKYFYVDHCHDTGIVRGLLCAKCNSAIGYLNDDIGTVERALNYLKLKGNLNVDKKSV